MKSQYRKSNSSVSDTCRFELDGMEITVVRKKIKHIYLRIYPHNGEIRVSAPYKMAESTIRQFVRSKSAWIRQKQKKIASQICTPSLEYQDQEQHYFCGEPYPLKIVERNASAKVELQDQSLVLYVRPNTKPEKRQQMLESWYRAHLKKTLPNLIEKYETKMGVQVREFGIKKMKTRWGTCNTRAGRIWLNLELAKKPPACLEYVVVHEMVHLLEQSHNARFYALMDQFMQDWKQHKEILNNFPNLSL